jgi:hypothetical protein
MDRLTLLKKLKDFGCLIKSTQLSNGYKDKVIFPNIPEKFCPTLTTYYTNKASYVIRLECGYNPTAFFVKDEESVLFYYTYLLKSFKLCLNLSQPIKDRYTVNKSLYPIDLFCWKKGWIILVISLKHNKIMVT